MVNFFLLSSIFYIETVTQVTGGENWQTDSKFALIRGQEKLITKDKDTRVENFPCKITQFERNIQKSTEMVAR